MSNTSPTASGSTGFSTSIKTRFKGLVAFIAIAVVMFGAVYWSTTPSNHIVVVNESGRELLHVTLELETDSSSERLWEWSQRTLAPNELHAESARVRFESSMVLRVSEKGAAVAKILVRPPGRYGRTMVVVADNFGQWSVN